MEDLSDARSEIIKELEGLGIVVNEDDLLMKFEEFCTMYHSSPTEIVEEWLAFTANKQIAPNPNLATLNQFEREGLSKKMAKTPQRNARKVTTPTSRNRPFKNESLDSVVLNKYDTPVKISGQKRHLTPETPPMARSPGYSPGVTGSRYESRTSKGDVTCFWGETATCKWTTDGQHAGIVVQHYDVESALTSRYKFMFEKIKDRANILNDMLEGAASLFKKKYQVDEWNHFCLPSQNEMTVAGRICGQGRLNSSSVILEGSIETCSGQTIPLDVSKLQNFAFFPGQIVAGKGRNVVGKAFLMSELYEPVYLPFPEQMPTSKADLLQIVIAAGPFTTADNLSYEPLTDLLSYVTENKPHVCILIGPLLDSRHEVLEKNLLEEDLDDVYDRLLLSIEKARKESNTHFVIVSSYNDIAQDCIYPTPPFAFKEFSKIHFHSDPTILSIDGVVIGVTSTDVLFHLSKEETTSPGAADRLGRLAQHILMQHSFYPLYPPNEEINIDYGNFETFARLPVMPHILIVPSELRCFIKDIKSCCCINPERLTKGVAGGNFARIQIDINGCRSSYGGPIANYIRGEIVRI